MRDSIFLYADWRFKKKKEKKVLKNGNVKRFQQKDDLNSWARVTIIWQPFIETPPEYSKM